MILFLDMDEVLCDFIGGACMEHGVDRSEMEKHRTPGEWSIVDPIAKATGKELDNEIFWEPINDYNRFWHNLNPTLYCSKLIDFVNRLHCEWYIVSSPQYNTDCVAGKLWWVERWLGKEYKEKLICTKHKYLFANKHTILVDDNEDNINLFRNCGGIGILFPHAGNRCHHISNDPLPYVKEMILHHTT